METNELCSPFFAAFKLMCELGNTVINRIYEARIDEITIKKPQPSSPRYRTVYVIRCINIKEDFTGFTQQIFSHERLLVFNKHKLYVIGDKSQSKSPNLMTSMLIKAAIYHVHCTACFNVLT